VQRLGTRERVLGIERGIDGRCVVDLEVAAIVPAVQIDRAIVGDAEQPRAQRRHLVELRQRVVGTRERVLDDVFPVGDRPGHPRAVAV